ncbi:hypothetical protein ACFSFY_14540 [Sporosarcina siberiensis]|uniref:dTDP-4-amino-4,6-dideoxygalactose transaminase n=1 Tax=Sporosarcina siberiensis TaxID=1365606 RepID=A0ABW4SIX1_9BACL
MEIGSEFHISTLDTLKTRSSILNNSDLLLNFGRTAIKLLVKSLQDNNGLKGILLPNYLCESIIQPINAINLPYQFYEIDKNFSVVIESLQEKIKPDWAVFHLDYFNIDKNHELLFYLKSIRSTNIIIEDITHSLFDRKEPIGHFQIASLRKWLGIPSGALIRTNGNTNMGKVTLLLNCKINTRVVEKRFYAANLKKNYLEMEELRGAKSEFLDLFSEAEVMLDESNIEVQNIDSISKQIINNFDFKSMIEIRRMNYQTLYEGLSVIPEIELLNGYPNEMKVPLGFPIKVKNRNELKSVLIDAEIYPPVHWPLPKDLLLIQTKANMHISENILTLPCDQRYSDIDMMRMINVIKKHYCR